MKKRLATLLIGNTLASFSITMLIQSGWGCFPVTAANLSLAHFTGLTVGITGMIIELMALLIATYRGEGIGITSIVNATYGSLMIDVFSFILPKHFLLGFGVILLPIAWALMGNAGFGDTGTNILTTSLLKQFKNLGMGKLRALLEATYLAVGFLGARNYITPFTFVLTLGFGYFLQFIYKLVKYDPVAIKHDYIIRRKSHDIEKEK